MNSFADFGLLPSLLKTLKDQRFSKPTEVQAHIIPLMMSAQSVVGVSETGSGKTLAYALPLLHTLKTLETEGQPVTAANTPRAVIMVPTRELGEQVSKVLKTLTHDTRLRVRPALGGMTLEQARRNTSGAFEILLATPGRLVQMMEKDLIHLNDVRVLIFDEADQMLDQGFLPNSNHIVDSCPQDIQLALFSATISATVQQMINDLFAKAEVIRSKGSGKVVSSLTTKNLQVEDGKRWPVLEKILAQKSAGGTLLFTNTREQCDKLAKELTDKGYNCAIYRGEMDKNERRMNLKKFRDGKVDLLVSTDLGGRGLDLENVDQVINYHLPRQMENYLHRAGRTARAGRKGMVINLVTERDQHLIDRLEGHKAAPLKNQPTGEERKSFAKTARPDNTRPAAGSFPKKAAKPRGPTREEARTGSGPVARRNTSPSAKKPLAKATAKSSGQPAAKNFVKASADSSAKPYVRGKKSKKENPRDTRRGRG